MPTVDDGATVLELDVVHWADIWFAIGVAVASVGFALLILLLLRWVYHLLDHR